ncbi:rhodanese-like domain-containing protein [uncultured Thiothrix sp.]|uniref:rhodanese-like domain-containing protein n=1 Tax=uncultured Thiothrix sp. TaxID=223185 RepID=UPI00260694D6|nr:rhodanese-like domain-containing protein [uncultured Thiothrix sp.]
MQNWTPQALAHQLNTAANAVQLLDVREPWEYQIVHLENSQLVPLTQLTNYALNELSKDLPVIVICHHGIRSAHACYLLERLGFQAINLTGGIDRWAREIDPSIPIY